MDRGHHGAMGAPCLDARHERHVLVVLTSVSLAHQRAPGACQAILTHCGCLVQLLEVVMDLGRVPIARLPSGDCWLSEDVVSLEDIDFAVAQVSDFGADNRAGIEKTLHRISCMRNREGKIVGLTCRVGRSCPGCAYMLSDLASSGFSILLLGRPGVGKTSVIRGVSQLLADACKKRVVIVDTSNEIGGDGDVPHPGIGNARRMQVRHPRMQHAVMIEAVENHMPEVIIMDEVGTELECAAAQTISQRGVQLVATAHGNELENVIKNPSLADLVGGISAVTLSDEEARRRQGQKSILERSGPPAFDVAIEMLDRNTWCVHSNLAEAVDTILAGGTAYGEVRECYSNGDVTSKPGYLYDHQNQPYQLPQESARHAVMKPATARSAALEMTSLHTASVTEREESGAMSLDGAMMVSEAKTFSQSADEEDYGCSITSTQKPCRSEVLCLYLWGVDAEMLWEVLGGMQLQDKVVLSEHLPQANAVLASKSKLKQRGVIRQQALDLGIPMYSLKSSTPAQLEKAVQDFLASQPVEEMRASVRAANIRPSKYDCDFSMDDYIPGEGGAFDRVEKEAIEEARHAILEIVIPRNRPVELLPRAPYILKMQMDLAEHYNVKCMTVGCGDEACLCILPPNAANSRERSCVEREMAAVATRLPDKN
eukprot:evm.model.scf_964EXC.7 EVM.evm.TU.scf_964EXC.7   scf_964EXC:34961-41894(+)